MAFRYLKEFISLEVYWRTYLLVLVPLLLLPIPLVIGDDVSKCAFVLLLMAVYWVFELLPLAVTSLLPVAMFPLMGIMSTKEITMFYMKDTCMLFIGGEIIYFIIRVSNSIEMFSLLMTKRLMYDKFYLSLGLIMAIAVEESGLHKRIALVALNLIGSSDRLLLLGFMIPTAFCSMWISNTATTAMMIPIIEAVLSEIEDEKNEPNCYGTFQKEDTTKRISLDYNPTIETNESSNENPADPIRNPRQVNEIFNTTLILSY